jgi:Holliday junction DNA helicase RuvB
VREEFVDPHKRSKDESDDGEMLDEVGLRPRSLSDFVGQRELKEHLSIVLEAA